MIARARVVGAFILALGLGSYAPDAAAQPHLAGVRHEGDDVLPAPSLGIAGTGLGLAATGVVLLATAEGETHCAAYAGCLRRSAEGTQRDAGTLLLGGGVGLALVGGASWASTRAAPLGAGEERDAPGSAVTGLLLTAIGGGALGAGALFGGAGRDEADFGRAAPLLGGGATLAAIGLPLWMLGASPEGPGERLEEARAEREGARRRDAKRRRDADLAQRAARGELPTRAASEGLAAMGGVLLGLGIAGGVASTVVATGDDGGGSGAGLSFEGLERTVGAAAGIGVSALVVVGGGLMLGLGLRRVPDEGAVDGAPASSALPTAVEVGPTRMSATWAF